MFGSSRLRICYAPWEGVFVGILKRAEAVTREEQVAVGGEIAQMFAAVTYPSEVRGSRLDGNTFSGEIWFGQMFWRRAMVEFAEGRVDSVKQVNPHAGWTLSNK